MATQAVVNGIEVRGERQGNGVGRGRSLHATKTFEPGELIAEFASPIVAIPSGTSAKSICSCCLSAHLAVKACTGCQAVGYCSVACQKAHWATIHKQECKAFKRVRSHVSQDWLPTPVRALLQILLRWDDSRTRNDIDVLESNIEAFRRVSMWNDLELQALAGCTYAGWETTTDNLKLAVEILCKIQTNSFDRTDEDVGDTGIFLDATLAMVNHSCIPNSIVAFAPRSRAFLRAESPIQAGDEITISYIDYTKPKIFRAKGLILYHFTCSCRRCTDDLDVYQVCKTSPLARFNRFPSLVPDVDVLRHPSIDTTVSENQRFRAEVDLIYATCVPEARALPEERIVSLKRQWNDCRILIAAKMWAVEPLAHVLQEAIKYFTEQQRFLSALAVECFVAVYSDPYKYVAPFKQWRLKGLLMIAKTLTNTTTQPSARDNHPPLIAALAEADVASIYQAILLMVVHHGPLAHSEEWGILSAARDMLKDVEAVQGRQRECEALLEWVRDPGCSSGQLFFRHTVLKPIMTLASCAIDIIRADLET